MSVSTFDAVIVAGGAGTRLGSAIPKAFVKLGGKPMLLHAVGSIASHVSTGRIVLVVPSDMIAETRALIASERLKREIAIVKAGKQRWQSVRNGAAAASAAEWVLVHDAARPFITHAVIDAVLEKAPQYDAVITATSETDTVRFFEGDCCRGTIDRTTLVRVGTPQLFRRSLLLESFQLAEDFPSPPTDEAVLMEKLGIPIGIAWGDPLNFKITTKSDFALAEALCVWRHR